MNTSPRYGFNLPNSENPEELADINKISENFLKAEEVFTNVSSSISNLKRYTDDRLEEKVSGEKVEVISEQSTHDQIPSAKSVADAISNMSGEFSVIVDDNFSAISENPVQNKVISEGVAPAISGSATGNPIALKDVSPLEHEMKVTVTRKQGELLIEGDIAGTDITEEGLYTISGLEEFNDGVGACCRVLFTDGKYYESYFYNVSDLTYEEYIESIGLKVGDIVIAKYDKEYEFFSLYSSEEPTLKKYGRNLLPYPYNVAGGFGNGKTITISGVTYTDNGDGTITLDGTSTEAHGLILCLECDFFRDGANYSIYGGSYSAGSNIIVFLKDESGADVYWASSSSAVKTWKKEYTFVRCYIQTQAGKTFNNYKISPQIEVDKRTAYQQYKEPIPYTAENGNISIIGNGEDMTLIADEGATITAEYNKDTNKVIERLVNAIISLGGNV